MVQKSQRATTFWMYVKQLNLVKNVDKLTINWCRIPCHQEYINLAYFGMDMWKHFQKTLTHQDQQVLLLLFLFFLLKKSDPLNYECVVTMTKLAFVFYQKSCSTYLRLQRSSRVHQSCEIPPQTHDQHIINRNYTACPKSFRTEPNVIRLCVFSSFVHSNSNSPTSTIPEVENTISGFGHER